MPSKSHSCSELTDGAKQLMEVKKEAEKEEDLKKQIQDWLVLFNDHLFCFFILWSSWCHMPSFTSIDPF